jgi:hypothetical protein
MIPDAPVASSTETAAATIGSTWPATRLRIVTGAVVARAPPVSDVSNESAVSVMSPVELVSVAPSNISPGEVVGVPLPAPPSPVPVIATRTSGRSPSIDSVESPLPTSCVGMSVPENVAPPARERT